MNKIKVNMAVEPNDIQTLHCSQYDTEERKFSVDLHENGVGVSPSSISNQLVYKSFKGGTEQILPTNTSTPSTSPIIADIQYKDGLREDEEFLYRENPSSVDGYAKIKEIRGNTLVWNQLVNNGNFASTSNWNATSGVSSFTVSSNVATIVASAEYSRVQQNFTYVQGHKYLLSFDAKKNSANDGLRLYYGNELGGQSYIFPNDTNWHTIAVIKTCTTGGTSTYPQVSNTSANVTWQQRNCMLIDLTQMFGSGNEPTIAEFEALFPLSYYAYDSGSLLSFNGSGIKTVGFNQWDEEWESGAYNQQTGAKMSASGIWRCTNFIKVIPNESYYFKVPITIRIFWYDGNYSFLGTDTVLNATKSVPSGASYLTFHVGQASYNDDVCINISDANKNGTYEPYEEHTLSLPISSYFPTGLKSAGSIYDQLDETGYITRVGEVDLGSLSWTYANQAGHLRFYTPKINAKITTGGQSVANAVCTVYNNISEGKVYGNVEVGICITTEGRIMVYDPSYTDAATFTTAMSGVYLCYELATPLENYGVVDLGTLEWTYQSSVSAFTSNVADRYIFDNSITYPNILCFGYTTGARYSSLSQLSSYADMTVTAQTTNTAIAIKNSSYTDANTFKNAMSGIYLLYELNEPKGITSASIVTNYGEMPLYNDNGELKADCIADVSQTSGFQIAKVKLKDENGEIYSNPFQIHTERSPQ